MNDYAAYHATDGDEVTFELDDGRDEVGPARVGRFHVYLDGDTLVVRWVGRSLDGALVVQPEASNAVKIRPGRYR